MEYFAKRADYIESTINEAKEMNEKASVNLETAEKKHVKRQVNIVKFLIKQR